jgi:hypothetical protein
LLTAALVHSLLAKIRCSFSASCWLSSCRKKKLADGNDSETGLLMGWSIGALIGGGHDYKRATEATEVVGAFTPHVPPGGTVILAGVEEADTEAMDLLAMRFGAALERRPADEVRAELKAMEKAAEELRKQESKDKRDGKRAERERKADEKRSKAVADTPGPQLGPAFTDAG